MLLVLASRHDLAARQAVARWRAAGVAAELMLGADLSQRGWRVATDGTPSRAMVGSRGVGADELDGVISRLPAVTADELAPALHPDDVAYAAAEMQAFLLAWLVSLPCPVLNRPTPGLLTGPPWAPEQWVAFAARHRHKVRELSRHAAPDAPADPTPATPPGERLEVVHVVGDRAFGAADEAAKKVAVRLAQAAELELLRVTFEPGEKRAAPTFVGADPWIDLQDAEIADAVLGRCRR